MMVRRSRSGITGGFYNLDWKLRKKVLPSYGAEIEYGTLSHNPPPERQPPIGKSVAGLCNAPRYDLHSFPGSVMLQRKEGAATAGQEISL